MRKAQKIRENTVPAEQNDESHTRADRRDEHRDEKQKSPHVPAFTVYALRTKREYDTQNDGDTRCGERSGERIAHCG